MGDIVPIDWRKGLARCEHLPGGVCFGGTVYERRDILLLHHRLLEKAHGAFMRGPVGDDSGSFPVAISRQPGANGGAEAGRSQSNTNTPSKSNARRSHAGKVDEESEDLKPLTTSSHHNSSRGSRQHSGSQGQPQAMGSRGTMSGPLTDATPIAEVASARKSQVAP